MYENTVLVSLLKVIGQSASQLFKSWKGFHLIPNRYVWVLNIKVLYVTPLWNVLILKLILVD